MTTHTYLFKLLGIMYTAYRRKKGCNIYSYSKLDILHPYGTVFKQFNIIILVSFNLAASISFSCVHKQKRAIAPRDANSYCLLPDGMCQFIHVNTTSNIVPSYCLIVYTLYYLSIILGIIKVGSASKHQYVL